MVRRDEVKTGYAVIVIDELTQDEFNGQVDHVDYFTNEVTVSFSDHDGKKARKEYLRHIGRKGNSLYISV